MRNIVNAVNLFFTRTPESFLAKALAMGLPKANLSGVEYMLKLGYRYTLVITTSLCTRRFNIDRTYGFAATRDGEIANRDAGRLAVQTTAIKLADSYDGKMSIYFDKSLRWGEGTQFPEDPVKEARREPMPFEGMAPYALAVAVGGGITKLLEMVPSGDPTAPTVVSWFVLGFGLFFAFLFKCAGAKA